MKPFDEVIKRPLITEKAVAMQEAQGAYAFEVSHSASKGAIREAIQAFFKVSVKNVRTMIVHGKVRRLGRHFGKRSNWKKAIVTLAEGEKLDLFEGK